MLKRLGDRIRSSWQMYPLGVLFGLGFDTATEVGVLALSAGAGGRLMPLPTALALPLLFAAGMSLLDTADGALMAHACGWAFSNPVRKVYYNITVTMLSVTVALGIGGAELLPVVARWAWFDVNTVGYGIVALFVVTWAASAVACKKRRIEECWAPVALELAESFGLEERPSNGAPRPAAPRAERLITPERQPRKSTARGTSRRGNIARSSQLIGPADGTASAEVQ